MARRDCAGSSPELEQGVTGAGLYLLLLTQIKTEESPEGWTPGPSQGNIRFLFTKVDAGIGIYHDSTHLTGRL